MGIPKWVMSLKPRTNNNNNNKKIRIIKKIKVLMFEYFQLLGELLVVCFYLSSHFLAIGSLIIKVQMKGQWELQI